MSHDGLKIKRLFYLRILDTDSENYFILLAFLVPDISGIQTWIPALKRVHKVQFEQQINEFKGFFCSPHIDEWQEITAFMWDFLGPINLNI